MTSNSDKGAKGLVVVSGVTGYLGAHVCREFLDAGYSVRGTVRKVAKQGENIPRGQEHLEKWKEAGDPIRVVQAELLDSDCWDAVMAPDNENGEKVHAVIHVASPFFTGCPDSEAEEKLFKPARDGTLNVLRAAQAANVPHVVLTSSVAAIKGGVSTKDSPRVLEDPESHWTDMDKADNYSKSKTKAERAAWDYLEQVEKESDQTAFTLSTINPCFIVGPPLSTSWATSHEPTRRLLMRELPAVPDLDFAVVDVRDVAKAHRLALETKDAQGKRFVVESGNTSMRAWAKTLRDEFRPLGYNPPTAKLPYFALWAASFFDKDITTILPSVGTGPKSCSNARAKSVLGIQFMDVNKSLIEHAHACLQQNVKGFRRTKQYDEKYK